MDDCKVTVGGNPIEFVDTGRGPTVLFVHGFPLDHTMWRFQIDELSDRYRILCPDLRGFGTSRSDPHPMSMRRFADQLAQLLDDLKINEPVVFCGLSMGGYIGWQFLKQYPERVSHLVACDTRAANDTEPVSRARKFAAASVRQTGSAPIADAMTEKLFYRATDPTKKEVADQVHAVISRTDPESIARGHLAMSERPDFTDGLTEIKIPVLFVVGTHDEITTPEEMRHNADCVADATFLEIPDAGHMAPLENPIEFNRGLIKFLDRHHVGSS